MTKKEMNSRADTGRYLSSPTIQTRNGRSIHTEQISDHMKFISASHSGSRELSQIALLEHEAARRDMAYELHDSVNPLLCVAKLYLDQLSPVTEKDITAKNKLPSLSAQRLRM